MAVWRCVCFVCIGNTKFGLIGVGIGALGVGCFLLLLCRAGSTLDGEHTIVPRDFLGHGVAQYSVWLLVLPRAQLWWPLLVEMPDAL